jgi:Ca2+-binding EF-hand superfamily protein
MILKFQSVFFTHIMILIVKLCDDYDFDFSCCCFKSVVNSDFFESASKSSFLKFKTKSLAKSLNFSLFCRSEIETLCRIYIKLVAKCQVNTRALTKSVRATHVDGIDRTVFRELMHSTFDIVTEEKLMERIFAAWEKGHDGSTLRLEIFLKGLSVFLRGTFTEKISFCFRVYDLNSDGFITKDEMFTLLKNSLIKNPQDEDPDEGVKDLVEITMRKLDLDKDGKVRHFHGSQIVVNNN